MIGSYGEPWSLCPEEARHREVDPVTLSTRFAITLFILTTVIFIKILRYVIKMNLKNNLIFHLRNFLPFCLFVFFSFFLQNKIDDDNTLTFGWHSNY